MAHTEISVFLAATLGAISNLGRVGLGAYEEAIVCKEWIHLSYGPKDVDRKP